jgi:nucleoside-diphosphate-sugar epimerase
MRYFVTGATGFVGSAVVQELLRANHKVLGLARTDANAKAVVAAGAEPHRGDLEDVDSLRRGAAESDGVVHTGFVHDFARYKEVCEIDRRAIEALGGALVGSQRPLVITSGTGMLGMGRPAVEDDRQAASADTVPRVASEQAADAVAARGVRVATVRLPPTVHGDNDHGFVPMLIDIARKTGVSAYVGDGSNAWAAVHRLDAGALYRLAVGHAFAAGTRFHGIGEEGVPFKAIAEAIGKRLGVPVASKTKEEAAAHFGFLAHFAGGDMRASSQRTREALGWKPTHVGLLADMEGGGYFAKG